MQSRPSEATYYEAIVRTEVSKIEEMQRRRELQDLLSKQKLLLSEAQAQEQEIQKRKERILEVKSLIHDGQGFQVFGGSSTPVAEHDKKANRKELTRLQMETDDFIDHLDRLRKERAKLEPAIEEMKTNISLVARERQDAKDMLRNQQAIKNSERKKALLRLAKECDPHSTSCAEALGRLMLRTPDYCLDHFCEDLEMPRTSHADLDAEQETRQKEVQELHLTLKRPAWESMLAEVVRLRLYVDDQAQKAQQQHKKAIYELLGMVCNIQLPVMIREHVETVLQHTMEETLFRDKTYVGTLQDNPVPYGHLTVVTARWPKELKRQSADVHPEEVVSIGGMAGYEALHSYCAKRISEYNHKYTKDRARGLPLLQRTHSAAVRDREAALEAIVTSTGHTKLYNLVEKNPDIFDSEGVTEGALSEESLQVCKVLIERRIMKAEKEDPLLHITAPVEICLHKIIAQVIQEVKVAEHHVVDTSNHWYVRIDAVKRVTELAKRGSQDAQTFMLTLAKEEPHWVLKKFAATEALTLVSALPLEDASRVLEEIVPFAFFFPAYDAEESERKLCQTVREAVQQTFTSCYPKWPSPVKDRANACCNSYVDRHGGAEVYRAVLDHLRSELAEFWSMPAVKKDTGMWKLRHSMLEAALAEEAR
mmetsp:Transcript_52287/g.124727  ORF Transcript_52287/g.124727 Transcript_52287/m.124727 type:complete len:650 (+) Transcript_52287:76-2025(+)